MRSVWDELTQNTGGRKREIIAAAGVAQLAAHRPAKEKVAGLIPHQGSQPGLQVPQDGGT